MTVIQFPSRPVSRRATEEEDDFEFCMTVQCIKADTRTRVELYRRRQIARRELQQAASAQKGL